MKNTPRTDNGFKNIIPALSGEEYRQLEQDILEAGCCRNPIVLWKGFIIDGNNRFEICTKHGVKYEIINMGFNSCKNFNHLTMAVFLHWQCL